MTNEEVDKKWQVAGSAFSAMGLVTLAACVTVPTAEAPTPVAAAPIQLATEDQADLPVAIKGVLTAMREASENKGCTPQLLLVNSGSVVETVGLCAWKIDGDEFTTVGFRSTKDNPNPEVINMRLTGEEIAGGIMFSYKQPSPDAGAAANVEIVDKSTNLLFVHDNGDLDYYAENGQMVPYLRGVQPSALQKLIDSFKVQVAEASGQTPTPEPTLVLNTATLAVTLTSPTSQFTSEPTLVATATKALTAIPSTETPVATTTPVLKEIDPTLPAGSFFCQREYCFDVIVKTTQNEIILDQARAALLSAFQGLPTSLSPIDGIRSSSTYNRNLLNSAGINTLDQLKKKGFILPAGVEIPERVRGDFYIRGRKLDKPLVLDVIKFRFLPPGTVTQDQLDVLVPDFSYSLVFLNNSGQNRYGYSTELGKDGNYHFILNMYSEVGPEWVLQPTKEQMISDPTTSTEQLNMIFMAFLQLLREIPKDGAGSPNNGDNSFFDIVKGLRGGADQYELGPTIQLFEPVNQADLGSAAP